MKTGHFDESGKAGFIIDTINLPVPWEYIYQNGRILLKVDQFGLVHAQADPPGDIMLFRRDGLQKYSGWPVWLKSAAFSGGAFCNFFRPNFLGGNPAAEPQNFKITYLPDHAEYYFEHEGLAVRTELLCAYEDAAVIMKLEVKNLRDEAIPVSFIPALLPYVNPAALAPWDRPEWYLKTGFGSEEHFVFWTQLMDMNSAVGNRRAVALLTDRESLTSVEISYERFVGQGSFERPEALFKSCLERFSGAGGRFGEYNDDNTLFGYPPVYAAQYDHVIKPGETKTLTQVLCMVGIGADGQPLIFDMESRRIYFDDQKLQNEKNKINDKFNSFFNIRSIDTPDKALNRYVNEWLPLQMYWVASLDRGWPSGMRGSRDSANDFTAMAALDGGWSRDILERLMSCQRSDGWYPRQYSALGRKGKHDMRGHVDAGAWVIELLYEYLCHTGDFEILSHKVPWLDNDKEDTVLTHSLQTMEYYLKDTNIGEHGLCKIGEGDWLDSVNRAGISGRGESVTVTNQVIIALTYMLDILSTVGNGGNYLPGLDLSALLETYDGKRRQFKDNLRKHAYNKSGYFNSVFNDSGKWLFSDCDPDGRRRVYGPANWYSISSGAASPDLVESVLKELDFLASPMGYRLYWPPMGDIPIDGVGRSGSGDLAAGLWENGNVYNQGSHGFLGRALAAAGKGDLLYETLLYLLPFDQKKHPTEKTLTPPYAVVNCWQQVPGFMHRGGLCFLTGSIAMGLRLVYDWMFGIRPALRGLAVDPCIPSYHKELKANFIYKGKAVRINIENSAGKQTGPDIVTVNGETVRESRTDYFSGRNVHVIDGSLLEREQNVIEIHM